MNYTKKCSLLLLLLVLIVSSCDRGPKKWESENWKFHNIVEVDSVKKMISFPMDENKVIIDSRPFRPKYVKGHIPGAISIPYSKFDKMTDMLPKDKKTQIVFYCGGLKCPLSHKSAWKAEDLGYKNIAVFAKGFPEWKKQPGNYPTVSVEWLKKQIDAKKVLVVDSRPKRKKYDKAHIPGAISIPFSTFDKMTSLLPKDKSAPIVFYCGGFHCPLSHKSAAKAIKLGYKKVSVFAAGFPAWKKFMGIKANVAIKTGAEEGSIDNALFLKLMKEDPAQLFLVDVRDPGEFKKATLKNAVNIPVEKLEARMRELPTNKTVVFICGTGARSGEAFYMIKDLKPSITNVYYLDGTLAINKDGTFTLTKPE